MGMREQEDGGANDPFPLNPPHAAPFLVYAAATVPNRGAASCLAVQPRRRREVLGPTRRKVCGSGVAMAPSPFFFFFFSFFLTGRQGRPL